MESAAPGYEILERLHESQSSVVYRALRQADQTPVVLKVLRPDNSPALAQRRLRREYELASGVCAEGVVHVYGLEEHQNTLCMVQQDLGGVSLDKWLTGHRLSLNQVLLVGVQVAEALCHLHARSVLHNEINPTHVIWNVATERVQITDFGAATGPGADAAEAESRGPAGEMRSYASPEQTGRIEGFVDHRSDLYALGVTLYEMLTGCLPFRSSDPMTLVHSHIAQRPREVRQLAPDVPSIVSDIVMKLLEKDVARRYQSAQGLKTDLEACRDYLSRYGDLRDPGIELGRDEPVPELRIAQQLYGREAELVALERIFDRARAGGVEVVMIAGWSGVGKTALVEEFRHRSDATRARFAWGKHDQFRTSVPYHAITQAFRGLCRDLLMLEPRQLERMRERLSAAMGDNAQVIGEVIPDLQRIIGDQPVPEALGTLEAKNRFHLVFLAFVRALCESGRPLVIFLDDLQWSDRPTLDLLERLVTSPDAGSMMLVGTFRDHEVQDGHPLLQALERIEQAASLTRISLQPLSLSHVTTVLADALPRRSSELLPLAKLIHAKTSGNPFFLGQFVKTLHERGLLRCDRASSLWSWDMDRIVRQEFTDNVVELTICRLQLLPETLQQIARVAACIGDSFDVLSLSMACDRGPARLREDLLQMVEAGFLVPVESPSATKATAGAPDNREFKFLHDRVQQAAYALLPDADRKSIHAKMGRALLEKYPNRGLEEHIFSLVEHLNEAVELLGTLERVRLAELNLVAGTKARESTAYEPAARYLEVGLKLLPAGSWQSRYDLCLALHQEAATALYLSGGFDRAFELADEVLQHAVSIYDKLRICVLRIEMEAALLHTPRVIELTLETLRMLGIVLESEVPEVTDVDRLLDLPPMTDRAARAALPILSSCVPAAYQSDLELLHRLVYTMVALSLRHGNDPHSAFGYVMYGLLLSSTPDTSDTGYRFGQMALDVVKKFQARSIACRVEHIFHSHIRFTTDPLREAIGPMKAAIATGLATGDLEFVTHISNVCWLNILFSDPDLHNVKSELENQLRLVETVRSEHGATFAAIFRQLVSSLVGASADGTAAVEPCFDEVTVAARLKKVKQFNLLAFLHTVKLIVCYLFDDRAGAFAHAKTVLDEGYDSAMSSMYVQHVCYFYCCLAFLSRCEELQDSERQECMSRVEVFRRTLKALSERCPENYQVFSLLVEAEMKRVAGDTWRACEHYEQAVLAARTYRLVYLEALGHELTGGFWSARGKPEFALSCLRQARDCYGIWGASRKVQQLEAKHPGLVEEARVSSATAAHALDVNTVIKASQAISGELDLDSLLATVMRIIVENAGAEKAALVLGREGDFFVRAVALGTGEVTFLEDEIEQSGAVCASMVRLVLRTGRDVLVRDAQEESEFCRDPQVAQRRLRSVLCTPMQHRDQLIGALYLENNLIAGAFTEGRRQLLRLLANQAGIALENARLLSERQHYAEDLVQEIAVRRRTEERLRERERDLFVTLNSIGDSVIATNSNHEITWMNPVAEKLTGWQTVAAQGRPLEDVFRVVSASSGPTRALGVLDKPDLGRASELLQDEVLIARDGTETQISESRAPIKDEAGQILGLVLVFRDVTQQRVLEEQLRQSQKMEAVGQLAGGIAHDFNNVLGGVLGLAELLTIRVANDSVSREYAEMIIQSCATARELVQKLLVFSRKSKGGRKVVDVHVLIQSVSAMLRCGVHKSVQIETDIGAERSLVCADATGLQNALLNLGLNARDAMPEGGRLSIATRLVASQEAGLARFGGPGVREQVEIRVSDTGEGMSEEVRAHAFEPFYTTKEVGKGTGLGLAVVYNTVKAAGGTVEIQSAVGRGTVINVRMPVANKAELPVAAPERSEHEGPARGTGRVLLVDDEQAIRLVAGKMLQELGYEITFAEDGRQAVDMYEHDRDSIDLIILDIIMPRMNGSAAFHRIREINPAAKIIVATGGGPQSKTGGLLDAGALTILHKPYRMYELSQAIAHALRGGG